MPNKTYRRIGTAYVRTLNGHNHFFALHSLTGRGYVVYGPMGHSIGHVRSLREFRSFI